MSRVIEINMPITSTRAYLKVMNGPFGLAPKELDVLTEFVKLKISNQRNNTSIYVFSAANKKVVSKELDLVNINVYMKRLLEKKAINKNAAGVYSIHPMLSPKPDEQYKVVFNFNNVSKAD